MKSLKTAEVARRAGYSVQQIRNLEQAGVLPPATRTDTGYRHYVDIHVHSANAYRALAAGVGPVEAKKILQAVHQRPLEQALAMLDAAHARLDAERRELRLAEQAGQAISSEPIEDVRATDAMSVSELAAALGVRASTLRHWEAEELLTPDRDPARGTRRYTPSHVRDARIVHQLRAAGYRIEPLRALMPDLRHGRRLEEITAALAARHASIMTRSRALLEGAAAVLATVRECEMAGSTSCHF
ncbi:MerR family transcriptional regulator [Kibdelosporangium philippinense]|uniref:MerR family transcriptional regulator n=1 Tax=Kibdelosporangium philippinense TaxID=211113 RepID=A0ABS8Z848_9PSEU|nr:MerR family transcriptional regulator [Kibdelosporangium philippinense]MCE7004049.1 MerR family transcriptional regulator [Kibdelosporangium philippinense]